MTPAKPRKTPCASCPYRKSVPSGVWESHEYEKLPAYDGETWEQPAAPFFCHQADGHVCSGWLGYNDPYRLLAVRLAVSAEKMDPSCMDYTTDVPLFASGTEAAAHGMKDVLKPGPEAEKVITKLIQKKEATE